MRARLASAVLVSLLPALALAQPSLTEPVQPRQEPVQPRPEPVKSASTARIAALATTAAGVGMSYLAVDHEYAPLGTVGLVTILVGPSAGHIYAGETRHAVGMTALRAGGLLVFALGVSSATYESRCVVGPCPQPDHTNGQIAMAVGGLAVLGSAVYDVWDAGRAADRANAKHAASVQIAPTMMMSSNGRTLPALALGGTF